MTALCGSEAEQRTGGVFRRKRTLKLGTLQALRDRLGLALALERLSDP